MSSPLKNVGCPFLCYTETSQITCPLQGQYATTSRGNFSLSTTHPSAEEPLYLVQRAAIVSGMWEG